MRRRGVHLFSVLAVVLLAGGLVLPASAAGRTITVNPGIGIYVNGQKLNPTDANGSAVEVFSYNGTTYLPVRAISEALGLTVQWDAASNSVRITRQGGTAAVSGGSSGSQSTAPKRITIYPGISVYLDGTLLKPKDANGNAVEVFSSNGTTYLPVRAIGEALGLEVTWDAASNSVRVGQSGGGQSAGIPAGYVHPSTRDWDDIFGVWELDCEIWTQASKDAQGSWAWLTFRADGTVDFLSQNLDLKGTYVLKPGAKATEGEAYAIATFPDRVCEITIYQMVMDVHGLPEISYAVQVGPSTNTGTLTTWSFFKYSDEEMFGAPD